MTVLTPSYKDGGAERRLGQRSRSLNSTPNARDLTSPQGLILFSISCLSSIGLLSSTMSATCEPLLEALKDCLMRSDCVLKKGKLPSECLRQHTDELPDSCKSLRQAVFECKRGLVSQLGSQLYALRFFIDMNVQVDMRKRFRGNQAAIMVSNPWQVTLSDAYSELLTGQRTAREKKGRGHRRALRL